MSIRGMGVSVAGVWDALTWDGHVGILQCFALYCFAYGRPRETHSGTVTDEVAIALCITVLHLFSCMLSAMHVLVLILLTRDTA